MAHRRLGLVKAVTALMRSLLALVIVLLWGAAFAKAEPLGLRRFPQAVDPACNKGHSKIYDECGSQTALFARALEAARTSGKVLLVSYGAEWCIWCHVFEAHLVGETGSFRYVFDGSDVTLNEHAVSTAEAEAKALRDYAAKTFILVNIEGDNARDGTTVVAGTGVKMVDVTGYPCIFSVTPQGKLGAVFNHDAAEVRRDTAVDWYRGYDRKSLLAQLKRLHDAAQTKPAAR